MYTRSYIQTYIGAQKYLTDYNYNCRMYKVIIDKYNFFNMRQEYDCHINDD